MENDELIELSPTLKLMIAQELRDRHGIDKWKEYNCLIGCRFSKDELAKIEKLELKNPKDGDLKGIEFFPNLRSLSVKSTMSDEYATRREIYSINDHDVTCIEKCKNLESLSIINQSEITSIDLSKLQKLSDIDIHNNTNLMAIENIDMLPELSFLTCYGNMSLRDVAHLDRAIVQNKDNLMEMNLDVMLFPKAIGYKPFDGSYNQEAMNAIYDVNGVTNNVMWSENVTLAKNTTINTYNMVEMHNKACQILHDNLPKHASTLDTVVAVERYLAENVTYDEDSRDHGHTKSVETSMGIRMVTGHKNGTNGAYDCLVHKSCVCQGYTRGEQYLLGLRGIKTREVSCYAGQDTIGFSDFSHFNDRNLRLRSERPKEGYHSIVRIDDYYCLYSDPCWNAGCYQQGDKSMPFTLKTKDEISKTHTLSSQEAEWDTNYTEKRSRIAESLNTNSLFRKARADEIKGQRAKLQQDVIGIVRSVNGRAY